MYQNQHGTVVEKGKTEAIDFPRLWRTLLRSRSVIVAGVTAGVLGAALVTWYQPSTYESEAVIRVGEERDRVNLVQGLMPPGLGAMAGLGGGEVQTDIALMKSRRVAETVVDSLALHVQLVAPATVRDSVFEVVHAPRDAQPGAYRLTRREDGTYAVRPERASTDVQTPESVSIGRPFRLGTAELILRPELAANPPSQIRVAIHPFQDVVSAMRRNLRVTRPDPGARVVGVRFRHPDPALAASVPNIVTDTYVRQKGASARTEATAAVEFLNEQVTLYQRQLTDAESRLRAFRESAQIVEPRAQATEQVRRFAELRASQDDLKAEREALTRLLARLESRPADPQRPVSYRELATVPRFLTSGTVENLLKSLTDYENERSALLVRRTASSIDVEAINQRILELENQLRQLAVSYVDNLSHQIAALDEPLSRSVEQLGSFPSREIEFMRLLREHQLLEQVYTLLQTRLKEEEIRSASNVTNAEVIDTALVPSRPVAPRPAFNLVLGAVFGLVLGMGGALARAGLDSKVRTADDVASVALGAPLLAEVPKAEQTAALNGHRTVRFRQLLPVRNQIDGDAARRSLDGAPQLRSGEAYRTLRTLLTLNPNDLAPRVLAITSSTAGEGKEHSAADLAISLARQGMRTLLMDADGQSHPLHALLGCGPAPGLTEVLFGRTDVDEATHTLKLDPDTSLDLLPIGSGATGAGEFVQAPRVRQLLDELRSRYDAVILNAPPVSDTPGLAIYGAVADAALLVTRAGFTEKRAAHLSALTLQRLGIKVAGVVLRDAELSGVAAASGMSVASSGRES